MKRNPVLLPFCGILMLGLFLWIVAAKLRGADAVPKSARLFDDLPTKRVDPPSGPFQFHAVGVKVFVFEPSSGRVWQLFEETGAFRASPYFTKFGNSMRWSPPTMQEEGQKMLEEIKGSPVP